MIQTVSQLRLSYFRCLFFYDFISFATSSVAMVYPNMGYDKNTALLQNTDLPPK
jgi:hypothetical protein